jgi:hypothetical protein
VTLLSSRRYAIGRPGVSEAALKVSPLRGETLRPGLPIEDAGLPRATTDRLIGTGIQTLGEIADLREWELFKRGLWLGDVRKIVAALSRNGLSLRDGTLGGPVRDARSAGHTLDRRAGARGSRQSTSWRRERDAAIVAARARGDTLEEAGAPFGIGRERVRQILASADAADAEYSRGARARRQLADAELHRTDVLARWKAGSQPREIATELGLSRTAVSAVIAKLATTADRAERRRVLFTAARCARPLGYSDLYLTEAVGRVIEQVGRVPTSKRYGEIARAAGLPSLSTIENRFGGWNAAVLAAGYTPMPSKQRSYERRWTDQSCLEALRDLVADLGELPSQDVYRRLSPERPGLPSASTVRTRLGRWSTIAERLEREGPYPRSSETGEWRPPSVPLPTNVHDQTDRRTAHLIALVEGGATLTQAGSVYGIGRERVRQLLKEAG